MRRVAPVSLLVGLACLPAAGATPVQKESTAATLTFSFSGYANNVRVRPPLVGKWQLGVARIRGSGSLGASGVAGSFVDTDDPRLSQYDNRCLRAKVIGYSYKQAPHAAWTKITLNVEITRSSHPDDECSPGVRGILVLYDAKANLPNGEPGDYVTLGHWNGKCNTHVHGWTNADGGARTDPPHGGPPDGGQRAIVTAEL